MPPGGIFPLSKEPSRAVTVWDTPSRLCQVMVVPAATVCVPLMKAMLRISRSIAPVACGDVVGVLVGAVGVVVVGDAVVVVGAVVVVTAGCVAVVGVPVGALVVVTMVVVGVTVSVRSGLVRVSVVVVTGGAVGDEVVVIVAVVVGGVLVAVVVVAVPPPQAARMTVTISRRPAVTAVRKAEPMARRDFMAMVPFRKTRTACGTASGIVSQQAAARCQPREAEKP